MSTLPNLKGYHRPKSIVEALALLEKNSGSILVIAGGTKLVLSNDQTVQELVDISALNLAYIKEDSGVVRIGATTTLQKMAESPILKKMTNGLLAEAALRTHYSRMIRNVSTLGGELVTTTPLSVLYCALLVLQAQVRIAGGEEFALAMNIFLNKKGLGGGLLIEVLIPEMADHSYAALVPVNIQSAVAPVICACARVSLSSGFCKAVKIAVTGTAPVPHRLHSAEQVLEGKLFSPANIAEAAGVACETVQPISDSLASAEYRQEVCQVVVERALSECLARAEESE